MFELLGDLEAQTAYKVLEAPAIMDDFYLHLVDWSSQNVLAVGLTNFVYLWNALTRFEPVIHYAFVCLRVYLMDELTASTAK